jgi:glycosidase
MMTTKGIPLIYYGDEIGMAGGGDPDNRRFMQWEGLSEHQVWLREGLAALIDIRHRHPVLRHGTRSTLGVGHHTYVFEMASGGDRIYVALNRGDSAEPAQGLPPGSYTELVSDSPVTAPLSIPARSALILAP